MNMKAIFAVMNTTLAEVKIRSEKPPSLPSSLPPFLPSSLRPSLFPDDEDFYNLLGTKHQHNTEELFEDLF